MDLGISTNPTPELYTIKVTGEIDIPDIRGSVRVVASKVALSIVIKNPASGFSQIIISGPCKVS